MFLKIIWKRDVTKKEICCLNLTMNHFDSFLCWGVLMHIYEIEKAFNKLCRVLKPGGYLSHLRSKSKCTRISNWMDY